MIVQYFEQIQALLQTVQKEEIENLQVAAQKMADCIEKDGLVYVFGCGHSHMIGEELFYRAGGLVPVYPLLVEELMLHKGAVQSSELEKQNDYAKSFMEQYPVNKNDLLIVISNSGRNPVPIDVAKIAREKGALTIGISSNNYKELKSRHKEGIFLSDVVDLTIDNHIEVGDALFTRSNMDVSFGPASTAITMVIINAIVSEAINILLGKDKTPPVWKSGNVDGTKDYNQLLVEKYKNRIAILK